MVTNRMSAKLEGEKVAGDQDLMAKKMLPVPLLFLFPRSDLSVGSTYLLKPLNHIPAPQSNPKTRLRPHNICLNCWPSFLHFIPQSKDLWPDQ